MNTMFRTLSLGLLFLASHLLCLVSSQECYDESRLGTPSNENCGTMIDLVCRNSPNTQEVLEGESITVMCSLATNTPTFSVRRASCNSGIFEQITSNSTGYEIDGKMLTILNARQEDEGAYSCSNSMSNSPTSISCVYVSGLARFRTCDLGTPVTFGYVSDSISQMNSCYQTLNVTEGQVTLDTRLMFSEGGCCGCREYVQRLAVRFGGFSSPTMYTCDEDIVLCIDKNDFVVSRQSTDAFDFLLSVDLNVSNSGQDIYIEIEVSIPETSNTRRMFWKVFEVTVNPREHRATTCDSTCDWIIHSSASSKMAPSSYVTTSPPTTMSSTSSATIMTSNPTDNTGIGGVGVDPGESVVGPAIGAAVVIIVIIAGVVIIAAVLLSRRRRTELKDLTKTPKKEEIFYESVDVVKLPSTTQRSEIHVYRESVYNFDGNQQLELHLESKICAKV